MILFRILLIFVILQIVSTGRGGRRKKELRQYYDEIANIVKFKRALDIYKDLGGFKKYKADYNKYQSLFCKYYNI